jgi:hypothetical protein
MAFSAAQLEQDSAFERYILDDVAPALFPDRASQVFDYTGERGLPFRLHASVVTRTVHARVHVNGRPTELDLTPLVFAAAWKIFDLAMDNILGPESSGQPPRISKKCKVALNGHGPSPRPAPFANDQDLWKRYMHLYANTADLRNSVVHRQFTLHPDGRLEATANPGQSRLATVMTREELENFFRVAQGFYTALISGKLRTRERENLLFLLDQLQAHHSLGALPGRQITRTSIVLAYPTSTNSGALEYDARPAVAEAQGRFPTGAVDLLLKLPDGTIVGGDLEDAPTDMASMIDPVNLPKWLSVRPSSEWTTWERFYKG